MWYTVVEGVRVCFGVFADEGGLAGVGEKEARVGITKPTDLNGLSAESAYVGKEGFNTSKGQKYTAEAAPAFVLVPSQVIETIVWVERFEDCVVVPGSVRARSEAVE